MISFLYLYLQLVAITFLYMTLWFGFSLIKQRNDVVDTAWGFGFLLLTTYTYITQGISSDRGLLILILITLWSCRLSLHLYLRNKDKDEDYRYKEWREQWGASVIIRSYLQVFLLQGSFLLIIVSPAIVTTFYRGNELNFLDMLGVCIWIIGFLFETIGDWQLKKFLENKANSGKIMQTGLWRYTRHPNYFGEVTMWWGLWIIALSVPFGFYSIIGPLTITFLILKVSGIPMLEKKMEGNPDFIAYKKRTSAFFPLPPK